MAGQLTFDDVLQPLQIEPRASRPASIDERFERFHAANPHVYAALREMAIEMRAQGIRRYSVDALMQVLRWRSALKFGPDGEWKLNDHYTSRYARMLMDQEPSLAGFFSIRALRPKDSA